MTKATNKNILAGGVLLLVFCGLCQQAMAMDSEDAPATVIIVYLQELYTAVHFDHQLHTELASCNTCHHHTTGDGPKSQKCARCHANSGAVADVSCSGCHKHSQATVTPLTTSSAAQAYHIDKPTIKGALHLKCRGCHQAEGGPTGCQDCHAFTTKGRKRFVVDLGIDG